MHKRPPKLLQLINAFSQVSGRKINSKKSVVPIYTNDKWAEKELRESTPFTIVSNNRKYLGVALIKQVKDLCDQYFKSLKKVVKEDVVSRKDLSCLWISKISTVYFYVLSSAMNNS